MQLCGKDVSWHRLERITIVEGGKACSSILFQKWLFLGRNYFSGTYFLIKEYEGNETYLPQCTMPGGSQWLRNLARLNIWHIISVKQARVWQSFVSGKEAVECEMILHTKCRRDTFLNLSLLKSENFVAPACNRFSVWFIFL